jgi:hypothetical protein
MKPLSESGLRPRRDEFADSEPIRNKMAEIGCDDTAFYLLLLEHDCKCEAMRFFAQGGIKSFKDEQLKMLGKLFHEYKVSDEGADKEIALTNLCLKIVSFLGPAKLEDPAEAWLRENDTKYLETRSSWVG